MEAWKYEPSPDLDQGLVERLRGFPRQPEMSVYALRSLAHFKLRAWLRLYHRFTIHGREHLPRGRSFVLVANHSSHLDALCLLASLPFKTLHRAFPAAAADYFFSSPPRTLFSSIFINALPFERQIQGGQSLAVCGELLANPGNVLILFPEGTRATDGRLGRFRSGVGRLVAGRDIPVVPCHLSGAHRAWPKGRAVPRPYRLMLRIGEPRSYGDRSDAREEVQEIVAALRDEVARLGKSG